MSSKVVDVTGGLRRSTDANGYYQEFLYDSAGSLVQVVEKPQTGRNSTLFTASYIYGIGAFQESSQDRALGQRTRWHDGLGQLRHWRDAKNLDVYAEYDALSRIIFRSEPDTQTSWVWGSNPADSDVGQLRSMSSTAASETYTEEFFYDSVGRLQQQRIALPGEATPYVYDFAYHPTRGLLDTLTYPASTSGYRFALKYDAPNGILKSISDANASGTVFWALNEAAGGLNAFGQVTHDKLGGIARMRSFDAVTGGLERITAGPSGNETALQNASIGYDDVGSVSQRQNSLGSLPASLTESFDYGDPNNADSLDRLTHVDLTDGTGTSATLDLAYDEFGNLQRKVDTSGTAAAVDLSIGWTSYNYPTSISAPWLSESASFAYGPDRQRWRMVYQTGAATEITYYLGGLMEKVVTSAGTEYRHYLPANGEMIGLYSRASTGASTLRYLLTDHQGSVDTIADSAGTALVNASFTPYGLRRDATDWSGPPGSTADSVTRQGYTFQTVLGRMGLNHMNGRVQDAITGTFLSPDPFITDSTNTQAFNRYAYVINNPLTYTDPSGFDLFDDDDGFPMYFPPLLPDWLFHDDDNDGDSNLSECVRRGCDVWMWHSNSPTFDPATKVAGMDSRGVARTGSTVDGTGCFHIPCAAIAGPDDSTLPSFFRGLALEYRSVVADPAPTAESVGRGVRHTTDVAMTALGVMLTGGRVGVTGRAGLIDTSIVRFSQSSVSQVFRNGGTVDDLAAALSGPSGAELALTIGPIRLVERSGQLFTLDNRRLLAFSIAGRQVPYRMATPAEMAAESWKFTTKELQDMGWYVTVRGGAP